MSTQPAESDPRPSPEQEKALLNALEKYKATLMDHARLCVRKAGLAYDSTRIQVLAEDAFQIASTNAIKKARDFNPTRPATPWLKQFIFNAVRTLKKQEKKHSGLKLVGDLHPKHRSSDTGDLNDEDLFAFLGQADGRVDEQEEDPRIVWIRENASPDDCAVIELRLQGYSGASLAEALSRHLGKQIATGAAEVRLYRARRRLQEKYTSQQNQ